MLEAQLKAGSPSPAASPLHPGSSSSSPAPDAADGLHTGGASAQAMPASAAERAAALDAATLASQQLREVKQRQYTLHQELDQLKADVSSCLWLAAAALAVCHPCDVSVQDSKQAYMAAGNHRRYYMLMQPTALQIRNAGDDIVRQKREHRQAVIGHAHVVASTLVSAGGELKQLLPHNLLFDAVVIDEVITGTSSSIVMNVRLR